MGETKRYRQTNESNDKESEIIRIKKSPDAHAPGLPLKCSFKHIVELVYLSGDLLQYPYLLFEFRL